MRMRSFTVPDELWDRLQAACKRRRKRTGESVYASSVIRQQIIRWLAEEEHFTTEGEA